MRIMIGFETTGNRHVRIMTGHKRIMIEFDTAGSRQADEDNDDDNDWIVNLLLIFFSLNIGPIKVNVDFSSCFYIQRT
jgi:hypothetical protein